MTEAAPPFEERLTVPWLWRVVAIGLAIGSAAYFTVYAHGAVARAVGYVLIVVVIQAALWWLGRPRVGVADGFLTARRGGAARRIGLDAVLDARSVQVREALRPGCFALTRPWITTGVVLDTREGRWVLSSRHPEELARAVRTASLRDQPG